MIGLCCAGLLAATLAPIVQNWRAVPSDDLPWSYYPMFSQPVGDSYEVTHVVGIDRGRREHVVPYRYVSTGGLNEVRGYTRRAVHDDAQRFCAAVAQRLRAHPQAAPAELREVVVRTGDYVLTAFYAGRIEARSLTEHARCPVEP